MQVSFDIMKHGNELMNFVNFLYILIYYTNEYSETPTLGHLYKSAIIRVRVLMKLCVGQCSSSRKHYIMLHHII